eukprot:m.27997 g.27997  ORF g.27997 m.27997 type:complete len:68 (-) comp9004_c0_seq1:2542-2745(-)
MYCFVCTCKNADRNERESTLSCARTEEHAYNMCPPKPAVLNNDVQRHKYLQAKTRTLGRWKCAIDRH